ncbi:hypothetical protein [Stenotrophomonas sp.]|uniref:hypothetical protein n=1 Tax=Stenotrophomonas sp. TaxID=69392 RepID=UPI0028AA0EB4|nr:hypothetical protein [Stenotrophomonas sp.]
MDRAAATEAWWAAADAASLQRQLDLRERPVRGASGGEAKTQRERWMMVRWLTAWASQLSYPVLVNKRESPDFLVASGDDRAGVECMEVVPEAFKQLQAKLDGINSGWVRPVSRSAPAAGRADWDSPLIRQLLADTFEGSPWLGDEPERLWVEVMRWAVDKKRVVRRKPGFAEQPSNVLLLYDNWPLPAVAFVEEADPGVLRGWALAALDELSAQLRATGAHADFQQIDILRQGWLLSFTDAGIQRIRYLPTDAE